MTDRSSFRQLPSVDRLLQAREVADLLARTARPVVVGACRDALAAARARVGAGAAAPGLDELAADAAARVETAERLPLRSVINATGVVIHTNLGRAPLSDEAVAAMDEVARGYSNLEFDLDTGERGSRHTHLGPLLRQVTGAEDGFAVNNNAAALLLCLATLAVDRDVLVSRGQAVEIGGGFRIPDVLRQSGANLVEVGTTNRTYLRDYEAAITPNTALLLHVHSSNFRIVGFTHEVDGPELARLGESRGIAVLDDVGSGALLDTSEYGMSREPLVRESVAARATLVCFSGDKLLGGPQAGIIVGRADAVARARRHPLARAVRADKASIAGLAATLRHYARGEATEKVPVWRMIATPRSVLAARAESWRGQVAGLGLIARLIDGRSTVGGGSLPGETLPTVMLAIEPDESGAIGPRGLSVKDLSARLRAAARPVIGRIEGGALLLDPRTVRPADEEALLASLREAAGYVRAGP